MTSLLHNSRKHDISFHANGRIDISAHIARQLSLQPGDVIDIVSHQGEWYLCVKLRAGSYCGRHEGQVYPTHRSGRGSFRTWSRPLARCVLDATGQSGSLRLPCGEPVTFEGNLYITIIYRHRL